MAALCKTRHEWDNANARPFLETQKAMPPLCSFRKLCFSFSLLSGRLSSSHRGGADEDQTGLTGKAKHELRARERSDRVLVIFRRRSTRTVSATVTSEDGKDGIKRSKRFRDWADFSSTVGRGGTEQGATKSLRLVIFASAAATRQSHATAWHCFPFSGV